MLFFLNAYKYMYSLGYSLYVTDLNPDVLIVLATYLLNNNILKCHQTSKMPLRIDLGPTIFLSGDTIL